MDTGTTRADRLLREFRSSGDSETFGAFFDATNDGLTVRARRLVDGAEVADDLVQATYLAALESIARYDPTRPAWPWLVGILTNQARVLRWKSDRRPEPDRLERPFAVDPSRSAEDHEFAERLEGAIADLGSVYEPVVILHLRHGLPANEIARVLGRPAGTVRTQVVRGMSILRQLLPASLASSLLVSVTPALTRAQVRAVVVERAATGTAVGAATATGGVKSAWWTWAAGAAAVVVGGAFVAVGGGGFGVDTGASTDDEPAPFAFDVTGEGEAEHDPPRLVAPGPRVPVAATAGGPTSDGASTAGEPGRASAELLPPIDVLFPVDREVPPGAGGVFGGRSVGRVRLERSAPEISGAIGRGLAWLTRHQSPDGRWDADGFMALDDPQRGAACDGPGAPGRDLAVTAYALLAFLHDGSTGATGEGDASRAVQRGVYWLLGQQDAATGAFGGVADDRELLHHAVATLAVVECCGLSSNDRLRPFVERAVVCLERRCGPRGVWEWFAAGEDRSAEATVWAVLALRSAQAFGFEVERLGPLKDGGVELPEPASRRGRAARLLATFWLGHAPDERARSDGEANRGAVEWTAVNDLSRWLLMTRGSYQLGGKVWRDWSRTLAPVLDRAQRGDGNFDGSWDPNVAWVDGGRVYATAMALLCLETYYAHTRLVR